MRGCRRAEEALQDVGICGEWSHGQDGCLLHGPINGSLDTASKSISIENEDEEG